MRYLSVECPEGSYEIRYPGDRSERRFTGLQAILYLNPVLTSVASGPFADRFGGVLQLVVLRDEAFLKAEIWWKSVFRWGNLVEKRF